MSRGRLVTVGFLILVIVLLGQIGLHLSGMPSVQEHAGGMRLQHKTPPPDSTQAPAPPARLSASSPVSESTAIYYVSRKGNNTDGRSWATAWNELEEIDWSIIQPGDTILLDGGISELVYATSLTVGKSGTAAKPIIIKVSSDAGRNGKVVIDGGLRYWPCQATEPTPYREDHPAGTRRFGVDLHGQHWIIVDGTRSAGIEIKNHNQEGITFGGASHIRLSNLHIHHNTYARTPDGPGINISGDNIVLENLEIDNNGQDGIQGGDVTNLVLQDSYIHDHYCNHPDGFQIYYGTNHTIIIQRNIFHSSLQAIFLGGKKFDSSVVDVKVVYNIICGSTYGVVSNNDANRNWVVYNNTIIDIEAIGIHLFKSLEGMSVRNNILYKSKLLVRNGIQSNNLFYEVPNAPLENRSFRADPQFVDQAAGNYQLRASSAAIDQGVDVGLTRDYLGTPIPSGAGVDIGAFEYTTDLHSTPTTTCPQAPPK